MNTRQPVSIDLADFQKLRELSKKTGIPVTVMLRRAITAWLETNEKKLTKALGEG